MASIRNQTVRPREVVVVDDGSRDGTEAVARAEAPSMGAINLVVLAQPNKGAGAARNLAIAHAGEEFLAFLDSDDEWLPTKIERSLAYMAKGNLDFVAHNGFIVSNGRESYLDIAGRFAAARTDPFHGLYRRGFISTSSVVVRRDLVRAVGGFDEALLTGQDFDLWLRLMALPGTKADVFDEALTRYHISSSGITAGVERRLNNTLIIALRHASTLRRLTGRYLGSLWFRIIAVHVEAISAFARRRRFGSMAWTLLRLPASLILLTVRAICLAPRRGE